MNELNDVIFYKVSYVVLGDKYTGAIMNVEQEPQIGDEVTFDGNVFEIIEVMELMPPTGNFAFLHATCKFLHQAT